MAASQRIRSLGEYLKILRAHDALVAEPEGGAALADLPIRWVSCDSKAVRPSTLFICKGASFKRAYLVEAISQGAVAYIAERDLGVNVPFIHARDIRRALGILSDAAWDHPSGSIKVCAFTGTKGKTTSVFYLRSILTARARRTGGHDPAYLTGVTYDDGVEAGESVLTTPEAPELERRIANAVAADCDVLVMEASSQALKLHRTLGVEFAVGAFTNFAEDHISPIEHPTVEDYLASKLMLFRNCRTAVVNLDMGVAMRVCEAAASCERVLTYSLVDEGADIYLERWERTAEGLAATVRTPCFACDLTLPTPAYFNLANALGAIACAVALGAEAEDIVAGLAHVRVSGRMEVYPSASGQVVGVVDYAHNGMSLTALLSEMRESYPDRELTVVFGATGGKGLDRRDTMGAAAGKLADRIIITEDDPGPEDPADICEAIARAVAAEGSHAWEIVLDRPQAIAQAVAGAKRPAVVVVTGKGNDAFMLRRGVREPYEPDGEQLARLLADA